MMQFDEILNIRFEVFIALCSVVLVYLLVTRWRNVKKRSPPGPWGLPIVGYLPFISKAVHLNFMELAEKYGEVFSVRLGSEAVLVLNSARAAKEAFGKPEFLGRPPNNSFTVFGYKSSFFSDDVTLWHDQRKFVVQSLKELGLGKSKLEEQILEEISHCIQTLKSYNGEPVEFESVLTPNISNNIWALIFGSRLEYEDPDRKQLDENVDRTIKIIGQTAHHIFFPWIRHIPFIMKFLGYEGGISAYRSTYSILKKKIQELKDSFDPLNIRDFVDSYLAEIKSRKEKDPNTLFSEDRLIGNVIDLFGAGSESVRTTLSWCIYTMAAYPDVQKKVQREIEDVLGSNRSPEYSDQKLMPYTHAVILEIMRWKTIVPINALRYTTADTSVCGYDIPKGVTVTANFWAIHHDPDTWTEPEIFKPERFLNEDGKSVQKHPNFMPFSLGKRVCPGETMAYVEIFLNLVSILQKFDVEFPEGFKPTFEADVTITYRLKPYKIRLLLKT